MREKTFSFPEGALWRRSFCVGGMILPICTVVWAGAGGRIIEFVGACRE